MSEQDLSEISQQISQSPMNAGPATRSRFTYQDQCAVLALLSNLSSGRALGVLIEQATDFVLVNNELPALLVSVKHQDANTLRGEGWTLSRMKQEAVLNHLFDEWQRTGERARIAFYSNASLTGDARPLHTYCAQPAVRNPPDGSLVKKIASNISVSELQASSFLLHLDIPKQPLPRRNEMRAVLIDVCANYASSVGLDIDAARAVDRLTIEVAKRSEEAFGPVDWSLPLTEQSSRVRTTYNWLSSAEVVELIRQSDARSRDQAIHLEAVRAPSLAVGRTSELKELGKHRRQVVAGEAPPLLVFGLPGVGKTTLVRKYISEEFADGKYIVLDGSDHLVLEAQLREHDINVESYAARNPRRSFGLDAVWNQLEALHPGRVILIEDVSDVDEVSTLLPALSRCQILVSSRTANRPAQWRGLSVGSLSPEDGSAICNYLTPTMASQDAARLAELLGNHPLAITQACSLYLTTGERASQTIKLLEASTLDSLDHGSSASYKGRIGILLRAAVKNNLSGQMGTILRLLASFGVTRIPRSIIGEIGTVMMIFGPDEDYLEIKGLTPSAIYRRIRKNMGIPVAVPRFGSPLTRSMMLSELPREQLWGYMAELASLGLINIEHDFIEVHSLIAIAVNDVCPIEPDISRLSIGALLADVFENDNYSPASYLPMLRSWSERSVERSYMGTGTIGLYNEYSNSLSRSGFFAEALEWATVAHELVVTDPSLTLGMRDGFRLSLASRHANARDIARGIAICEEMLQRKGPVHPVHWLRALELVGLGYASTGDRAGCERTLPLFDKVETWYGGLQNAYLHCVGQVTGDWQKLDDLHLSLWTETENRTSLDLAYWQSVLNLVPDRITPQEFAVEARIVVSRLQDMGNKVNAMQILGMIVNGLLEEPSRVNMIEAKQALSDMNALLVELDGLSSEDQTLHRTAEGRWYIMNGEYWKGVSLLQPAMRDLKQDFPKSVLLPAILINLGNARFCLGDFARGMRLVNAARLLDTELWGPKHPETMFDTELLASLRSALTALESIHGVDGAERMRGGKVPTMYPLEGQV